VIHAALEQYIRLQRKTLKGKGQIDGKGQVIFADFDKKRPVYQFDLTNLKKNIVEPLRKGYEERKVRCELDLAFTKEWKPCDWMASNVYVRLKMDVMHIVGDKTVVTDWKTGRFKPEEEFDDQLSAYAVGALSAGFGEETSARLIFTDEGQVVNTDAGNLTRIQLPKAQKEWDKRAKKMLTDTMFVPKPAMHCRWCPYSANKGGPCKF
ncbi:MAG TPA: PD-(D/E)XK nuclease family protein, partial [Geobacteraceae bacterium]